MSGARGGNVQMPSGRGFTVRLPYITVCDWVDSVSDRCADIHSTHFHARL